jgi:hypothetical protein
MSELPRASLSGSSVRRDAYVDRPPQGGGSGPLARALRANQAPVHKNRIPTIRELLALVVNGALILPQRYFRGMFLDVVV